MSRNITELKSSFPDVKFLYSFKANPNEHVIDTVKENGMGCDAASSGEVWKAVIAGFPAKDIYYSAPGKSVEDIESTIGICNIIADSINEIKIINSVAERKDMHVGIGVRINPDFGFGKNDPAPSKFGVDEDELFRFLSKEHTDHASINGIHVHLRSQCLDPLEIREYYVNMIGLAKMVMEFTDLSYVNMGSCIGVPYSGSDEPLDLRSLGERSSKMFSSFKRAHKDTELLIESGRYVTCDAGVYVTKVMDVKDSRDKTFIILKNTLNGFVRPPIAHVISAYDPNASPCEPLFTSPDAFRLEVIDPADENQTVTVTGNACTSADTIAEDIVMPMMKKGDVIMITNAGSYGYVLTPMQFSSIDRPLEFFIDSDGKVIDSYTKKIDDILSFDIWGRGMASLEKELGQDDARRFLDMMSLNMQDYSRWRKDQRSDL